jgi:SAM-dependent methyltransferase
LQGDDIFDNFYTSIYDKLVQHHKIVEAETAIVLEDWKKAMSLKDMRILDAGCGTGIATVSFAHKGVGGVVGIDKSPSMIKYAKQHMSERANLSEQQKNAIEFRQNDLLSPNAASAAEFTHACLFYFTAYYFRDLDTIFRNMHLWVRPGGTLAVEVVNKHKFEPILESASPWTGISPQRYTKERLTKSKVVFDKFDYEADFDLEDPRAEFREVIRFKDGSVRRQKHIFWMPDIKKIIHTAGLAGWTYTKYTDLISIGFPYGYILYFVHN